MITSSVEHVGCKSVQAALEMLEHFLPSDSAETDFESWGHFSLSLSNGEKRLSNDCRQSQTSLIYIKLYIYI